MRFHVEKFEAGKELSLRQIWDIQVSILNYFSEYCKRNDLSFFLAGGTLLGAIRHQGFVPWDDDVDIVMPRPDWERFMSMNRIEFGPYELRTYQYTPEKHPRPLFRIVDTRYFMQINHIQKYLPIWIDVLPLDGLPSEVKERKKHYKKAKVLQWMIARSYSNFFKEKRKPVRALKWVVCLPLRIIGPTFFIRRLESLAKQYDYDKSEYVGSFTCGYGFREGVRKEVFSAPKEAFFHGCSFPVPVGYDVILSSVYGNYMMLPPEKKRKIHMLGAWENAAYFQQ